MLDVSTIAAIITGVLALAGAAGTAWLSGWNEQRSQDRRTLKSLARYAVPLVIAAWDLANWFDDILNDKFYHPDLCKAYGDGWSTRFTSYLLGQYLAGIHILREKTYFLAHVNGARVHQLRRLLWKIQNEFISMQYVERESREMRWVEHDILAIQEHMTVACHSDGAGHDRDLRTMSWVEFKDNYDVKEPESADSMSPDLGNRQSSGSSEGKSLELKKIFEWYETEFQRVVYRRFKYLYATKHKGHLNPQEAEVPRDTLITQELITGHQKEEVLIQEELLEDPSAGLVIPDWRIRRLQHLLCDLVVLLDDVSAMKFNRPIRKCGMEFPKDVLASKFLVNNRVPCDCASLDCNPEQQDFEHRQIQGGKMKDYYPKTDELDSLHRTPTWQNTFVPRRMEIEEKHISRESAV